MSSPFDAAQQLTGMWMDFATKMGTAGVAFSPDSDPPEAGKQMRGAVFGAMSQYADQFMRSPQFLGMMKQSLDASIAFRKQINDFLTQLHHSTQSVAQQDIDSLLLSVRHVEHRTLDRMDAIVEKLDKIAERLEALETTKDKNGQHNMEASHVDR